MCSTSGVALHLAALSNNLVPTEDTADGKEDDQNEETRSEQQFIYLYFNRFLWTCKDVLAQDLVMLCPSCVRLWLEPRLVTQW